MAEFPELPEKPESSLDVWIGITVVLMATFMGICNVKGNNIGQKMQHQLVERNDKWAWFQARNIRQAVYESTSDELSIPVATETNDGKKVREELSKKYRDRAKSQEEKAKTQEEDAINAEKEYERLGKKDDQFDLCEAALAIGLAMMGVTALIKRKWMFVMALFPIAFGVYMGVAGFMGMDTDSAAIKWLIDWLS